MRVLLKKKIRKQLLFFKLVFGIRPPYKVIVDSKLLQKALTNKIFLKEELPRILQDTAYPTVTSCIVHELKSLGEDYSGAAVMAKRLPRAPCEHEKPVDSSTCILSIIGEKNASKYCVASDDESLKSSLRNIPGVPLLYLSGNRILLEITSSASRAAASQIAKEKTDLPETEKVTVEKQLAPEGTGNKPNVSNPKKRKKAKGPNPLSVKKKKQKTEPQPPPSQPSEPKKRKRNRKKKTTSASTDSSEPVNKTE